MKSHVTLLVALTSLLLNSPTAHAACLWPFCGWGYAANYPAPYPMAAPAWNSYSTFYTPWYPVAPSFNSCCPTACCNPCDNCSSGNCATPASQPTSGSLKPKSDPQFQDRRNTPGDTNTNTDNRTLPPVDDLTQPANPDPNPAPTDTFSPPARRQPANPTQPADSFNSPANPADTTEPAPFDANDSISNKPPVSDPAEPNLPQPTDSSTVPPTDSFSPNPPEKSPADNPQSLRSNPSRSNHSRTAELTSHKRLANSLRSNTPANTNSADQHNRVRWISAPIPANHARL